MVLRPTLTLEYDLVEAGVTALHFKSTSVYHRAFFLLLSVEADAGTGLACCLRATAPPTIVTSSIHLLVEMQYPEISLCLDLTDEQCSCKSYPASPPSNKRLLCYSLSK